MEKLSISRQQVQRNLKELQKDSPLVREDSNGYDRVSNDSLNELAQVAIYLNR